MSPRVWPSAEEEKGGVQRRLIKQKGRGNTSRWPLEAAEGEEGKPFFGFAASCAAIVGSKLPVLQLASIESQHRRAR